MKNLKYNIEIKDQEDNLISGAFGETPIENFNKLFSLNLIEKFKEAINKLEELNKKNE